MAENAVDDFEVTEDETGTYPLAEAALDRC